MRQLQEFLAVALAEMRSARRLVRTWLFIVLSMLTGLLSYLYYAGIHGVTSSMSATIGSIQPRFLMASVGVFMLWIFVVAIVFLAFDIRARDQRDRMAEVLDSRAVGNLALLGGRLAGLVFIAWLSVLLLVLLIQSLGSIALAFDWPFGEPVEPVSMLAFLTIDAVPLLVLWGTVVILLATTLRNRLLVAIVALALLGAQLWVLFQLPLYLMPPLSGLSGFSNVLSDVVPRFATASELFQRACLLLLAAGLLLAAAATHPRPDQGSRARRLAAGVGLAAAGCAGIFFLAWQATAAMSQRADWLAAHQARQDDVAADVERIGGRVAIAPGDALELDLKYRLAIPEPLDQLVFSLNPGMTVKSLRLDGQAASYSHELGLLVVDLPAPLAVGSEATLTLAAAGIPDPTFAYLDSAIDLPRQTSDAGGLTLLGSEASLFESGYVALMPGVFWMPVPGAATGRDDPERYGRDYYTVDLEVQAPTGWLVAGPGRRQESDRHFRFRPTAPVPEVALIASRFERRATTIDDIELELLMNPKHLRNVAFFADAADVIRERIKELFADAEKLGLAYPYGGLSLVEVPGQLRSYGDGWRMGSVQAMPGVMLLREYGFPTSRFDFRFRQPERFEKTEGGIAAAKANALDGFFQNDVSGGNPLHEAVRNLFAFQTGARGEGAIALDFVSHELAVQLVTRRRSGFFSAHALGSSEGMQALIGETVINMVTGQAQSISGSVYTAATSRPSIWNRALGAALADLQPGDDPQQALNVLWLKGPAIAESIIDGLGRDAAAAFLAELRRRYAGRNFTAADFAAAAAATGADLAPVVGDWLHDASLPGFLTSPVQAFRLADNEQGQPRYQIRVHVRNDEPTPGLVRMRLRSHGDDDSSRFEFGAPVRVEGHSSVELGLVSSQPPTDVWVSPYLSLNRRELHLPVPEVDQQRMASEEPFTSSRPSDWRPEAAAGIVVDDLDPGFSIRTDSARDGLRLGGAAAWNAGSADTDQGLPVFPLGVSFGPWSRQVLPDAWGKYRHTLARALPGDGRAEAVFAATLPAAGRWRLDYHLPNLNSRIGRVQTVGGGIAVGVNVGGTIAMGTYDMKVLANGETMPVEFDGTAAEIGWNDLGDFPLPAGEVSLVVSNATSGPVVVADAVRWRQVDAR